MLSEKDRVVILVNSTPNSTPGFRVAVRIAEELLRKGVEVTIILYMEASYCALRGSQALMMGGVEEKLRKLVDMGAKLLVCSSCLSARGMMDPENLTLLGNVIEFVKPASLHEVAEELCRARAVLNVM